MGEKASGKQPDALGVHPSNRRESYPGDEILGRAEPLSELVPTRRTSPDAVIIQYPSQRNLTASRWFILHMRKRLQTHWISLSLAGLTVIGATLITSPKSDAAEVVVRVAPPAARVETIPPPPGRAYAWDPGHWQWNGRTYVWIPGQYIAYPHRYRRWIPGHWVNRGGGWYWVQGHWRRF
jgi:hypothetical protein